MDLESYLLEVEKAGATVSLGSVSYGASRHLIDGFASRGAALHVPVEEVAAIDRVELSFGAANAQSVVGWSNITGLQVRDNRVFSGTLALEQALEGWGSIRVEGTLLDGESKPEDDFNQGAITDAEENRGFSALARISDEDGRIRVEGAFSRSRYTNPADAFLIQDEEAVVEVQEETDSAHYVDLELGLLQGLELGEEWFVDATFSYQHERVAPLFQTLASFVTPDQESHRFDLGTTAGPISLQATGSLSRDNLDDLVSVLTTKTQQIGAGAQVEPGTWFGNPEDLDGGVAAWLPSLSYSFDRTHQFGEGVPVDSDFNESHVPDQFSDSHVLGLSWNGEIWSLGYELGHSKQNNRQVGREAADFKTWTHAFSGSVQPWEIVDLGADLAIERTDSAEEARSDLVHAGSFTAGVRPLDGLSVTAAGSVTHAYDHARTNRRRDYTCDLDGSYDLEVRPWARTQVFARWSYRYGTFLDDVFEIDEETRAWTVNLGANLTLE